MGLKQLCEGPREASRAGVLITREEMPQRTSPLPFPSGAKSLTKRPQEDRALLPTVAHLGMVVRKKPQNFGIKEINLQSPDQNREPIT